MADDISFTLLLSNHHVKTWLFAVRWKAICVWASSIIIPLRYNTWKKYQYHSMRCDLSQAGNPNIGLSPKPLPFWNRNTAGELGRCHGCWCYGYFRNQAISIHDIDRENIDRLQNEVVFYNRKGFNYLYHYIIGKC